MAGKIDVKSGDPYRDTSGHFGTSPDQKLKDSFALLQGKKFISHEDNKKKIDATKKDAKAKLAELRGTGITNSKFSGTQAEADEFAKDSAIQDTIYHGTTSSASDSISQGGFDVGKSISDKLFGDGVYLTGDKEIADWYAGNAAKKSGDATTVSMKVNVKNPYIEDTNDFSHTIGKYGVNQFSFDMYTWGVENKKWSNPAGYEKKTEKISNYNKLTREFGNHLLETHDAIVQKNSKGIEVMVIKDPKNIMVINNG